MKICVRPPKAEQFDVEIDASETVRVLKEKMSMCKAEYRPELLKLVYKGRILTDEMVLKDTGMADGEFVVPMLSKPKVKEADAGAQAAPVAAPAAAAPAAAPAAAAPAAAAAVSPAVQAESNLVSGNDMQVTINTLCEMGFPRPEVEKCLRAAFNNPDRAVEYLMNGIPAQALAQHAPEPAPNAQAAQMAMAQAQAQAQAAAAPTAALPQIAPVTDTGPLAELRRHPLANILRMSAQNSEAVQLQEALSIISQKEPQLLALIAEHQEEFVKLLKEPMAAGMPTRMPGRGGHAQAQAQAQPPMDPVSAMMASLQQAAPQAQPAAQPEMSPADHQAVERLTALGFPLAAATQAYLACGRNEEMAANMIFESLEED